MTKGKRDEWSLSLPGNGWAANLDVDGLSAVPVSLNEFVMGDNVSSYFAMLSVLILCSSDRMLFDVVSASK